MRGSRFDRCQPNRVIMMDADLTPGSDLTGANLTGANLDGANLTRVIGANLSGALGVPPEYRQN